MKNNNYKIKILNKFGSLLSLTCLGVAPLGVIGVSNNDSIKVYDETDPTLFNENSFNDYQNEVGSDSFINTVGETFTLDDAALSEWGVTGGSIKFTITKDDPTTGGEDYGEVAISNNTELTAKDMIIKDTVTYQNNQYKITKIDGSCFYDNINLIDSLILSNNIEIINRGAFQNCIGLTSVTIGSGVTKIDENAFAGCENLSSVSIPKSVTTIIINAFSGCHFTSIEIDENNPTYKKATNVGSDATVIVSGGTELNNTCSNVVGSLACGDLIIPNTVTSINTNAFDGCAGLTRVTIGNSVTTIKADAFAQCINLSDISFGSDLQTIMFSSSTNAYPFDDCPITSIKIAEDNRYIGLATNVGDAQVVVQKSVTSEVPILNPDCKNVFCHLACGNLVIPDNVTAIPSYNSQLHLDIFGYTSITSVEIPDTVTSIGNSSFANCKDLTKIIVDSPTPPTLNEFVFSGINPEFNIYVPINSVEDYKAAPGWSDPMYKDRILPNISVTSIEINGMRGVNTTVGVEISTNYKSTVLPIEAINEVTWSLENNSQPEKITIDNDGKLTIHPDLPTGEYTCDIVATSTDGSNIKSDPFPITVTVNPNNNLAIIIGCSVGGVVLLGGITAGTIIGIKKHNKHKK